MQYDHEAVEATPSNYPFHTVIYNGIDHRRHHHPTSWRLDAAQAIEFTRIKSCKTMGSSAEILNFFVRNFGKRNFIYSTSMKESK